MDQESVDIGNGKLPPFQSQREKVRGTNVSQSVIGLR